MVKPATGGTSAKIWLLFPWPYIWLTLFDEQVHGDHPDCVSGVEEVTAELRRTVRVDLEAAHRAHLVHAAQETAQAEVVPLSAHVWGQKYRHGRINVRSSALVSTEILQLFDMCNFGRTEYL